MVKIKEYVRVAGAAAPYFGKFRVVVLRNLPGGVPSQMLRPQFDTKREAQIYRAGVRDGINLARNG